jgi:hypothetical protein
VGGYEIGEPRRMEAGDEASQHRVDGHAHERADERWTERSVRLNGQTT